MALPGNGIFVVKGEMAILVTAMRRGARWSTHSHQDEELDTLIRAFQDLKDDLNKIEDLRLIDPNVYLNPFLDVIRSEDTTGPVTSLALSAVNKFLSYNLIDPAHSSVPMVVDNIADAVTHARFVGTDHSSDGVVLMKILEVLRTLTLSTEGTMLTNDSLCEIMLACFRICFEIRLNELLRRTAEHYLKDMVQLVFMRLPQFSDDLRTTGVKQLKMISGTMEETRSKRKLRGTFLSKSKTEIHLNSRNTEDIQTPNLKPVHLQVNHLSTTPLTPGSNIVDMQGSITQNTPTYSEISDVNSPSMLSEQSDNGGLQCSPAMSSHDQLISEEIELGLSPQLNEKEENVLSQNNDGAHEKVTEIEPININENEPNQKLDGVNEEGTNKEYINPRGIRFTPQRTDGTLIPYGIASVREMFRFLITLCNPHDKQNTDAMIHLGLTLLTVVFEVGADSIGKYESLLALVKDELCRNLFSLLNTDRLSVFAANLQLSFLMFESLRTNLKFQLELYLTKLIEIIVSDSVKVTYEHKEVALDNIVQLWRISGLVTELYLNYDCDMYCSNLYEDLTKLLAKNAFPVFAGVYPTHLLSLDALLTVIENIEEHCILKLNNAVESPVGAEIDTGVFNSNITDKYSRQKVSERYPVREDLVAIKNIKKWLPQGTEYFNLKPKKGIQFLQEHGILKQEMDPHEIVVFLRENPGLDKKMIGEYISSRNNLQILETFVKMFDFTELRVDEALRLYLETFRLPGEAPLISLLLEHFAEHWHKCNGEPFANADAAFTLAYAVIMLNVDQHNQTVKKQKISMTNEGFKKNLKKVNGGNDFDQDMLDEIYNSIKNEEIVMPAEQTGIVKENYLWKVLLRRGASKDGAYIHVPNGVYDYDLFSLIWGPIVSALSFVFDKSEDAYIYNKAIKGFHRCAYISAHFGFTVNMDMLILTLCKFTLFHNRQKLSNCTVLFGSNVKAQLALKTIFFLTHQHGDNIREGWKHVFDIILSLYNNNLLPKSYMEAEDFIEPSGKIMLVCEPVQSQKQDTGLLSSLYSYMVSSSENLSKLPTPEEQEYMEQTRKCIKECSLDQLVTDSKFLHDDSLLELVKTLIELSKGPDIQKSLGYSYNENVTVFFLELLLRIVLQNRDRVMTIWQIVCDHIYKLVMNASHCDYQYLLERSVIGLLRLAIRLMRNEEMSPVVLQSLRMLLLLKPTTLHRISKQISYGLYELLKTSAQNIHTSADWSIIFTLLECVGAGAQPPKPVAEEHQTEQGTKSEGEGPGSSEEESLSTDRGYTSDSELTRTSKNENTPRSQSPIIIPTSAQAVTNSNSGGWILVGNEGEVHPVMGRTPPPNQYNLALEHNLGPHVPSALVKCNESLAFLVRDVAHITPYNFDNCVHCIRTFVEASLHEPKKTKRSGRARTKTPEKRREKFLTHKSPSSSPDEDGSDDDNLPSGYHQTPIQLLDLMHTLHTRTAQIFHWWAEEGGDVTQEISLWTIGWCPLLQGIGRLCCDTRKQVRMTAITYLQRALLVHDLQTLTGTEWENCFHKVLFPLLLYLLQPIDTYDIAAMEETRMRAATVLSKVFLHHLTPLLSLATFQSLWLTILDFMDKYMHADHSDLLYEAIPESLKNMLLVMDSAKIFEDQDGTGQLWYATWEKISGFLPHMKEELFRECDAINSLNTAQIQQAQVGVTQEVHEPTTYVLQHNIENATRSSIILQPPSSGHNIASPLFSHLGQMVSTPIGAPLIQSPIPLPVISSTATPVLQSVPVVPNLLSNTITQNQGHVFPVLYNNAQVTTTDIRPVSLYSEYIENPYNLASPESYSQVSNHPNRNVYESNSTDITNAVQLENFDEEINSAQVVSTEINDENVGENLETKQTNMFQSSNYFTNDSNLNVIPPGSEILFGAGSASENTNFVQSCNIPVSPVRTTCND